MFHMRGIDRVKSLEALGAQAKPVLSDVMPHDMFSTKIQSILSFEDIIFPRKFALTLCL